MTAADLAAELRRLHDAPEPLVLVNVWDVASARVVAGLPGCTALATASHAIAATHGYEDGEQIPLELMIDAIARIAAAVDLPVSADLEAGYGDAATTVRRAIGAGAVGGNLEDGMRPLDEALAAVEAAVRAGDAPGRADRGAQGQRARGTRRRDPGGVRIGGGRAGVVRAVAAPRRAGGTGRRRRGAAGRGAATRERLPRRLIAGEHARSRPRPTAADRHRRAYR